ncbi:MAG: hypothetical protein IJB57_02200 [Clostridia bacterium]|nr:hypothetical protein [Clostridia bacterium]
MAGYKYSDAYKSIKAPADLAVKVLNRKPQKKAFSYKSLISIAACIIILVSVFPMYLSFTDPDVNISASAPMTARYIGTQIPVELSLNRRSSVTVSNGSLEGYNGEDIKGSVTLIWNINIEVLNDCTLTVTDDFKATVYTLSYNENNDSWSINKN